MVKFNYLSAVLAVCDKTNTSRVRRLYIQSYNAFARHCVIKIKFNKGSTKGCMNFYYMSK